MVSAEARSNRPIAQAPLTYARYVFRMVDVLQSNSACKSVGRGWGCLFTIRSLAVSFFQRRPLCVTLDSNEQLIACPSSRGGHSKFWCYSDWCKAYGVTLSVLWPPILIIPERNVLSQFNEDKSKLSVPSARQHNRYCGLLTVV